MSDFTTRFTSKEQDWATPDELFEPLASEFSFTLDAAASSYNSKVGEHFFSEQDDALSLDWGDNVVWLNPPYGNTSGSLQDWVKKAYEASIAGATVVMLIPARTNTNWFHDYCLTKGEVRFIRGRPKFGDAPHGLPQPLCIVIFRPKESS